MDVTGGLAIYDPRSATIYHTVMGPEIAKLVQSCLRDRSISWPAPSVGPECGNSKSCESYLLAGPYQTVTPWPFTNQTENVDAFRLERAPIYQVDFWNIEEKDSIGIFDMKANCELYGGFDPDIEFSTLVCIADGNSKDELLACKIAYHYTHTSTGLTLTSMVCLSRGLLCHERYLSASCLAPQSVWLENTYAFLPTACRHCLLPHRVYNTRSKTSF